MSTSKCLMILSEKSSGSSACQKLLTKFSNVKHVSQTHHFESETLYWTKAASILGLPQLDMLDSIVPLEREKAKRDLITLLKDNIEGYSAPQDDVELIFDGWRLLCNTHAPIFVEKSPHHLCQWSAIQLIIDCIERLDDIDFFLVGLVRNPMDTIYSQFSRWKTRPEELQYQWLVAYKNLLKVKDIVKDRMVIVRYEDMVQSVRCMKPVFDFCGVASSDADQNYLHRKSISKWKRDRCFGFVLSDEVIELAKGYGYQEDDLANEKTSLWPVYREVARVGYKSKEYLIRIIGAGGGGFNNIISR